MPDCHTNLNIYCFFRVQLLKTNQQKLKQKCQTKTKICFAFYNNLLITARNFEKILAKLTKLLARN